MFVVCGSMQGDLIKIGDYAGEKKFFNAVYLNEYKELVQCELVMFKGDPSYFSTYRVVEQGGEKFADTDWEVTAMINTSRTDGITYRVVSWK